jgi:parallel beta-helix repeat protein
MSVTLSARVTTSNQSTVSNNTCSGGAGGGIAVEVGVANFGARGQPIDVERFWVGHASNCPLTKLRWWGCVDWQWDSAC